VKRLAINWSNSDTVEVVDDPHGPFVRAKEAEAEVAKLKTENERLKAFIRQLSSAAADLKASGEKAEARAETAERENEMLSAGEHMTASAVREHVRLETLAVTKRAEKAERERDALAGALGHVLTHGSLPPGYRVRDARKGEGTTGEGDDD
jgi:chromosome segregation ATPase